ncbi:MAG: hypothetical protein A2284_14580 [Deltaproteobacteria bacterium RIFOXYA12_FULL_61_11]|nr:MAG: hypothetical protein A2284_14580 [Deltaproteobacteria bacterium RIFOXYA12_FULL_61_11]
MRLLTVKSILWFFAGFGFVVILLRMLHGVGSVVALNDLLPWGLWKGGGVVALVPIGGAGFTLAAFVYVFHWRRYEPLARAAVLLGLMCYSSVAIGLTFDIGIWWRIVFPVFFWQFHSTLFEIAWCIMLYLGVLAFEFSHAILERLRWTTILHLVEKVSIVFIILGIALSTLHQSSLGTLFLATPYRLHPLWYSPLLPLLFFITAIGLGCLTITWVTLVTHWLYGVKQPLAPLTGLARIASIVLGAYLVLRLGDLLVAGKAGYFFTPDWNVLNFWVELLLSAILPIVFLSRRSYRESPTALFWIATAAIVGMSLNRVNVAGLATLSATQATYIPSWAEWFVTLGILSAAGLVYLLCVEHLRVFPTIGGAQVEGAHDLGTIDPAGWHTTFFRAPFAGARFFSAVFVAAVGLVLVLLPDSAVFGARPEPTPTRGPRSVELQRLEDASADLVQYVFPIEPDRGLETQRTRALLLDADANGRYVLFEHERHGDRLEEQGRTCAACHHQSLPFAQASSCRTCHRDMYQPTQIFDHGAHERSYGGNADCPTCHTDPTLPKTKATTVQCKECHPAMVETETLVRTGAGQEQSTLASGYKDAMHGLCVTCHQREVERGSKRPGFGECSACHRDVPTITGTLQRLREVAPRSTPMQSEGGRP